MLKKWNMPAVMGVMAMACSLNALATSNTLSNGGFEQGSLDEWSVEGAPVLTSSTVASGNYALLLNAEDSVSLTWASGLAVSDITEFSLDVQHLGGPLNQVLWTYTDGSSSQTVVDGLFESDGWLHFNLTSELSAGKKLSAFTFYGSSPDATYLDNVVVSVQAVPEPNSWFLMASGLLLLGWLQYRSPRRA